MTNETKELYKAALLGYDKQRERILVAIKALKKRLDITDQPGAARKHKISPEGRARIAAAQRKRWAAKKKTIKAASKDWFSKKGGK